jgi:hypothetical protein
MVIGPKTGMAVSSTVDAKLLHLVKKIVSSTTADDSSTNTSTNASPNIDYVVTILRTQNKEYLRKDVLVLKSQVQQAMQQIIMSSSSTANMNIHDGDDGSKDRKRKSRDDLLSHEEDDEEAYDRAVAEQEAMREQVDAVGGGLNASLRERYKVVQQEREINSKIQEEAATAALDPVAENGKTYAKTITSPARITGSTKKRKNLLKRSSSSVSGLNGDNIQSNASGPPPDFLLPVPRPMERYSDLGGMSEAITELKQLVEYPMIRPELYNHLGIDPPRGVLLRGPPGTGKSHLANAGKSKTIGVQTLRLSVPTDIARVLLICCVLQSRWRAGRALLSSFSTRTGIWHVW